MTYYCKCPDGTARRESGFCYACGLLPDPGVRAHHPVVREHFNGLKEMLQDAGVVPKPPLARPHWDHFVYQCLQRIEKGAAEYGPANFKKPGIDLIAEACEETFDLCVYPLLEIVKNEPDSVDAASLGEAARHAYLCYQSLQRYKEKVRGAAG